MHNNKKAFFICRLVLAMLIVVALGWASVSRSLGLFRHDMYWLQESLGGDKISHMLMGVGLIVAGYLIIRPKSPFLFMKMLLAAVFILVLEECSQIFLDTRQFDWTDLSMGVLGATLALMVFYLCSAFRSRVSLNTNGETS